VDSCCCDLGNAAGIWRKRSMYGWSVSEMMSWEGVRIEDKVQDAKHGSDRGAMHARIAAPERPQLEKGKSRRAGMKKEAIEDQEPTCWHGVVIGW
jgi:hypothetical protein